MTMGVVAGARRRAVVPPPPAGVFNDFNQADGTSLAQTLFGWADSPYGLRIKNQKLTAGVSNGDGSGSFTNVNYLVAEPGTAGAAWYHPTYTDQEFSYTVTSDKHPDLLGVFMRYQGTTQRKVRFELASFFASWSILYNVGGGDVSAAAVANPALSAGDVVSCRCVGDVYTASVNGTPVLTWDDSATHIFTPYIGGGGPSDQYVNFSFAEVSDPNASIDNFWFREAP